MLSSSFQTPVTLFRVPGSSVLRILGIVVSIRLLVAIWTAHTVGTVAFSEEFVSSWTRWDAEHYVLIADDGYRSPDEPPDRLAFISRFPPLFPLATAAVRAITPLSTAASGMLLSIGVMISGPRFFFVHPVFFILARIPSRLAKVGIALASLVALIVFSGRFVTGLWTF